jgi:PIN domain nuclease of toxin-antitoxin system
MAGQGLPRVESVTRDRDRRFGCGRRHLDVEVDIQGPDLHAQTTTVMLLDTNALIWVAQRDPRARRLLLAGRPLQAIAADTCWVLDEPAAAAWFLRAADLTWTRDPFDRLLAAQVLLRGWRLATATAVSSTDWDLTTRSSCSAAGWRGLPRATEARHHAQVRTTARA